jgi:hypothetical protein
MTVSYRLAAKTWTQCWIHSELVKETAQKRKVQPVQSIAQSSHEGVAFSTWTARRLSLLAAGWTAIVGLHHRTVFLGIAANVHRFSGRRGRTMAAMGKGKA